MQQKAFWSKTDELRRLCLEWLREPLLNPNTGYPIERNGPTFKMWQKRCKELNLDHRPKPTGEITWRKYQEWKTNPLVNPETGRKIKENGPTFKRIKKGLKKNPPEKKVTLLGEYYVPDAKGYVPCVKHLESWCIVRKDSGRKVWGALNKPAKNIRLVYYKDTWDYRNNHYAPVFLGGTAPKKPSAPTTEQNTTRPVVNFVKKEEPKKIIDRLFNIKR